MRTALSLRGARELGRHVLRRPDGQIRYPERQIEQIAHLAGQFSTASGIDMSISSTLVDRAQIRFREAADALRPFVGCFWVVTAECGATIHVVPDGSAAIAVQLDESARREWVLRGPLVRPDERHYKSPVTLVGVRLRPGVAFLLTATPSHTLVGRRLRLRANQAFRDLVSEDPDCRTADQCIDSLEHFLLHRFQNASLHRVVATAIHEIEHEHGGVRVEDVAARCSVSVRHLNRLMRAWVGYGAKRYASIVRFQSTLHAMDRTPSRAAAALAADNGYFDQAHLALDLVRFGGATPSRLASAGVADFSKTRCDDLP
jgi:AraC-like DNA-binding protein